MSGGLLFELIATKKGCEKDHRGKLVTNDDKLAELPDQPDFERMRGSYSKISAEAIRLNEIQLRSGFLWYLYAPEPVQEPKPKKTEEVPA
jgi:hypothetical protein